ncbi:hypothetical protein KIPB_005666 [Kipferlia bialata]|uniref:Uncharacterized protein n=1 Tax=Kipferlia bialata TaxID=797122 RepID=A0A9K3CXH6_9EUKA|nr:hypothetical protein KIPB_002748 [Kipferlia bialata]GIQ84215.1 hypothetical protein KIPB_005666 [Kipferlia bialata]|eukprot:g2748.t1
MGISIHGIASTWADVLKRVGQSKSLLVVVTSTLGSLTYDPDVWNAVCRWTGIGRGEWTKADTVRIPLGLNFITALIGLWSASRMVESGHMAEGGAEGETETAPADTERQSEAAPPTDTTETETSDADGTHPIRAAFSQALSTGSWILTCRPLYLVMLAATVLNHAARFLVTINARYMVAIGYPEGSLGVISSITGLLGIPTAALSLRMTRTMRPGPAFLLTSLVTVVAMGLLSLFIPWYGVLVSMLQYVSCLLPMPIVSVATHSLTKDPTQRATVVSFQSLLSMCGYGLACVVYSLVFDSDTEEGLRGSYAWFGPYQIMATLAVVLVVGVCLRKERREGGSELATFMAEVISKAPETPKSDTKTDTDGCTDTIEASGETHADDQV